MSYIVLANSTRVILPMRTRFQTPDRLPSLAGILVAEAKASGHCVHAYIELGKAGLPRPFKGERWCYDWRDDGEHLMACWLGFPNVFFSGGIDPNLRITIEALGRYGTDRGPLSSLSRINITVKPGAEPAPGPHAVKWLPEDSVFPAA